MRLAVALDGAGWHPAAWREPRARPAELFTARYWTDVIAEAERGLLDFVTIEDGFSVQSSRADRGGPGRLDAVLIAARVAPLTRHIGLIPTVIVTHTEPFHVSKAIATLDYASNGRAGVRVRVSASPQEAATSAAASRAGPAGPRDPAVRQLTPAVRRGGRLRRGGPAAVGQLGGRRRDPRRRHRPVHRPRTSCTTSTSPGGYFSVKGPSITPRPPQGQPIVAALGHAAGAVPAHRQVGRRRLRDAARRRPRPRHRGRDPRCAGRRRPGRVFADLVVFLGPTARRPRPSARRAWTSSRGTRTPATRPSSPARPRSWPTCCWTGSRPACPGFRLRPGAIPDDLEAITRDAGARTAAPRRVPHRYEAGTLRGLLGLRRPASRYAAVREQLTMTKQIHLAAHFPGVNNTTVWSDPQSGSHIEFSSFEHLARTAERAKFDFLFLAEGLRLREQNGQIYDLDVVGRPDTFTVLAALAAVTERLGLAGHDQLHLQRAVRGGPPVRQPRPPVRRPGGLERGHLLGRVHRRELPPRRLPAAGRPVRAGADVPARPPGSCSTPGAATRSSPTRSPACSSADPEAGPVRPRRRPLRHRRAVQRAPQPAGPAGHLPGRRLRRGPRVRRVQRGRDLQPARHAGRGPGVLRRRQGPAGQVRPHAGPAARSCPPRPSCSATPTPRRPSGPGTSGASRSAGRPRSRSSSSCGTGTCPATTRTARCPTSIPTRARTRSPAAGPACGCTGTRWPPRPSGGRRRRRRSCPSAS